jgi:hypothetical protein
MDAQSPRSDGSSSSGAAMSEPQRYWEPPSDLDESRDLIQDLCSRYDRDPPEQDIDDRRILLHHLSLLAAFLEQPVRDYRRRPTEDANELERLIDELSGVFEELDRLYADVRSVFKKVDAAEWSSLHIQLRELAKIYVAANAELGIYRRHLLGENDEGRTRSSLIVGSSELVHHFYEKLTRIVDHYERRGY